MINKHNYLIHLLVFILCSSVYMKAQHTITPTATYGAYLFNSENGSLFLQGRTFRQIFGGGLKYSYTIKDNRALVSELLYSSSSMEAEYGINFTTAYIPSGETPYIDTKISLEEYTLDFGIEQGISNNYIFGLGPSIAIVHRIISTSDNNPFSISALVDDLCSTHLGAYGYVQLLSRITSNESLILAFTIKIRYTHSIYFDNGGRNLDNYSQSYLRLLGSLGIRFKLDGQRAPARRVD
jgi:hypothetical protein